MTDEDMILHMPPKRSFYLEVEIGSVKRGVFRFVDDSLDDSPPYAVVDLRTHERGTFQTARDVKFFMWGRDFRGYTIYKRGVRFPWLDGDLSAFEQALEQV